MRGAYAQGQGLGGERRFDPRLYVVLDLDIAGGRSLGALAGEAIAGGATMLQVRAKRATTRELVNLTLQVLAVSRSSGVPVLVNDRTDVVLATGAAGVHLGEDDLPVAAARRILGEQGIVGSSAGSVAVARRSVVDGADYLGTGDVYGTSSKPDADQPIGLDGLAVVAQAVDLPVVAIGGIGPGRAGPAVLAGASGVAVISAVIAADDVVSSARELRSEVDAAVESRARRGAST